jgi:NAD(P)-dependent dehydrogenase (short-subunit alcohol dehydrogenase family)
MTGAVPEEIMQRVIETIPVRRLGRPDEVARVVVFLAEPASSYITGQIYSINGGLNM